jgi:2-iminobutanoate/2-iminopropanoate deaminase
VAQRHVDRRGRWLLGREVVYVQCVLADIADYSELNEWWRRQFPDVSNAPARFTFQAAALPFGAKIEIQAIAARSR